MKISIRRGLSVVLKGAPVQSIFPANEIRSVGIDGADYPDMRCELLVERGDRVAIGSPLFRDCKRPDIVVTATASGTVSEIALGPRRRLTALEITLGQNDALRFCVPAAPDRHGAQQLLLETGLWTSFRVRPFGRVPDPGSVPDAIFVTAIDTYPLAVEPKVVLSDEIGAFSRGVAFLSALTDGLVFVCQAPGEPFVNETSNIRCVQFSGPHPTGLAGTHAHRLFPVRDGRRVWQIQYQNVVAIGHLLESGRLFTDRVISLAGPCVRRPRLVRVPSGASLVDLIAGELTEGDKQILSGPAMAGRSSRFLGRHHWQVTALPHKQAPRRQRWLKALGAPMGAEPIIPTEALEQALGPRLPVVPLLRALSVGDVETAQRLGCLELLEEDMALLTYAAGGDQDFSVLLRAALDGIEGAT